jgi:twitching motility protein PilT
MLDLLAKVVRVGASDLHLKVGEPPICVIHGRLTRVKLPVLTAHDAKNLIYALLSPSQIDMFERRLALDLSYTIEGVGRFRLNIYHACGSVGAAIRMVPATAKSLEVLGLPGVLQRLTYERQGLLLVTGPTGSGKSTTLAALIEHYNATQDGHVVTIEDPIEMKGAQAGSSPARENASARSARPPIPSTMAAAARLDSASSARRERISA